MNRWFRWMMIASWVAALGATSLLAAEPAPRLVPGKTFSVPFPEMPPTFYDLFEKQDVPAQMTVYLPTNYDPGRKYPLLVFLNGWDGGTGTELGVARSLSEGRDFVCVSVPLFKAPGFQVSKPNAPSAGFIIYDPDGKAMWPFFRTMLR